MSVVAIYSMKGGVGKTTTAVNLAYLAAAAGQRTLLWDLDPQAASSFAFRIRPRVEGFGRKSLKSAEKLTASIKETDYDNLDLLPADFTYRKLDRLLGDFGNPQRVVTGLLDALSREYDIVFLDCPAGFSLMIEGIFAAADAVLVPTIPTVLSLRTVERVIKWAEGSDSPSELRVFFSMVDRRKALHRRACEWSAGRPDVFLLGQIPYASVVEQMAVRRMPLAVFAPRDAATTAFAALWTEFRTSLQQRMDAGVKPRDRWGRLLRTVESLVSRLEWADPALPVSEQLSSFERGDRHCAGDGSPSPDAQKDLGGGWEIRENSHGPHDVQFVHSFDTHRRDLQRCGFRLEFREHAETMLVVAEQSTGEGQQANTTRRVEVQVDRWWALQILSGTISPLTALESRLGRPVPRLLEDLHAMVGGWGLQRTSRIEILKSRPVITRPPYQPRPTDLLG